MRGAGRVRAGLGGVAAAFAWGASAASAGAQIKASESASMSQTIDGTVVSMEYSRPAARDRAPLFGGVVHWDERWTPGANTATRFRVSKDVHLDGVPVPQGSYSVWMDVVEEGPWTLILEPDTALYHTQPPDDADDQIRIPVEPASAPHMDALLWYFASVRPDGGELRMHWGETVASVDLEVEPTQRMTVTAEEARAVAGEWSAHWLGRDGEERQAWTLSLARDEDTGVLVGVQGGEGGQGEIYFVPRTEGIYLWAWGSDGAVWEVTDIMIEFLPDEDGAVRTFEARSGSDRIIARGGRADPTGP
ncbi:MAG: DUF2911 domain-containing protein [Longimicrobiales bacterium]